MGGRALFSRAGRIVQRAAPLACPRGREERREEHNRTSHRTENRPNPPPTPKYTQMVEQTPTTINIDLRLKSGQQALSDFATANAAAAQNAGVNDKENPLPTTGNSSRPTASHNALPQSTNRNDDKRPSVMEPITKPAYLGAKHDVRGFCIRHPRCRLMRSVDGKEDGGEGKQYFVFLFVL